VGGAPLTEGPSESIINPYEYREKLTSILHLLRAHLQSDFFR